jgi:hypothetical protein
LHDILKPFGKKRFEIFKDLRQLYGVIRQQEYSLMGKKLPVGELLNIDEEKTLAKNVQLFAACLSPPQRDRIHIFDFNSSNSFQNKIYDALVQG